jgi:hypothetical protein
MNNNRIPSDLSLTPPIECKFKVGDEVIFTNDYKVEFKLKIVGFKKQLDNIRPNNFIYLDSSSWWYAEDPKNLEFYW